MSDTVMIHKCASREVVFEYDRAEGLSKGERIGEAVVAALAAGVRLADCDLRRAYFRQKCSLEGRDFSGCDLEGAVFSGCNLRGARFVGARLAHSRFDRTELGGADFTRAECDGASFKGAHGEGVTFDRAALTRTDFSHVVMPAGRFPYALVENACLYGGAFERADFSFARLNDTNLATANCRRGSFVGAVMRLTTLESTDLSGTDLRELVLYRCPVHAADFSGADLRNAQIEGVLMERANTSGARFGRTAEVKRASARIESGVER